MAERRTIGQILMSFGRIDEEDVSAALEYQRDNGGYFGEALLALDLVTQEELEWGLASQFDLPYVFPEADTIDPEAAALVSPEWALAHLTLPITMTSDTLTVVVDSPIKTKAVDELSRWTDKRIDLALASATKIRELVRQVYARAGARESAEKPIPTKLPEAFGLALEAASARFGISVRRHKAWFWWDDGGTTRRRPLEGTWEEAMDQLVSPSPLEEIGDDDRRAEFSAHVSREAMVTPVEVSYLADESGREYLFRPVQEKNLLEERFTRPPQGLLSEVRLLSRSGAARFVVTSDPREVGHDILPHLPLLLLDSSLRSIYIHAADQPAADEAFSLAMPNDPEEWAQELETLRAFHFDVVTVDLSGNAQEWTSSALDVASVAFLLWEEDDDRRAAYEAGIRWELRIEKDEGDRLEWTLEPLQL